jgi:acyl-CoA thioesterase-1
VVFLGDSLTDGYHLPRSRSYPALVERRILARGWPFTVVNAGVSGDTSVDGLERLDDLLENRVDVLVLALGINDVLQGLPPERTRENLQRIIDRTRTRYPDAGVVLAGMRLWETWPGADARRFQALYPELARENGAALVPFLLEGVAGRTALNLEDGLHPNARGHELMAETVWNTLGPVLEDML